jgi:hypothetical protein
MKPLITFFCILTLAGHIHGQAPSKSRPAPAAKDAKTSSDSVAVLAGAGDIASCDDLAGAQATAKLLDNISGTVFAVGDLAYPDGSDEPKKGQRRSYGCGRTSKPTLQRVRWPTGISPVQFWSSTRRRSTSETTLGCTLCGERRRSNWRTRSPLRALRTARSFLEAHSSRH